MSSRAVVFNIPIFYREKYTLCLPKKSVLFVFNNSVSNYPILMIFSV